MTSENLSPRVIKRLSKEFAELQGQPPEGIKLIINTDNLTDVQAWVEGPQGTPYEGGCFRVRLSLSSEFPNVPPQGTFLTKIFHPNVSKAGEICVNVLKKDWKKEYGIGHILLTIKCLLIDPNPESALNEEAGRLLLEDYNSYAKHAKLYTSIHGTNSKIQFGTTSSSAPTLGKQNAPPPTPVTISSKLPAVSQENSGIASGTVPPATGARDPAAPGSGIAGSCTPPGSAASNSLPPQGSGYQQHLPLSDLASQPRQAGAAAGHLSESNLPEAAEAHPVGLATSALPPPKKRVAEKKPEVVKADKKRTLRRL